MVSRPVLGDFRVQQLRRADGRVAFTILDHDGKVFSIADLLLRGCRGGADRTFAYLLVDHSPKRRIEIPEAEGHRQ